jgi:dihydropteroate synthase
VRQRASPANRIVIDPGFGFGKSQEHNLELLRALGTLAATGYPVLAGLSRKSMLGGIAGPRRERARGGKRSRGVGAVARGAAIRQGARRARNC